MRLRSLRVWPLLVLLAGCGSSSDDTASTQPSTGAGGAAGQAGQGGSGGSAIGAGGAGAGGDSGSGATSGSGGSAGSGGDGAAGSSGSIAWPNPACTPVTSAVDPLSLVVPTMGSGGFGYAAGNAFPGAAVPHGLAKVGPDTSGELGTVKFLHYDGYYYGDDTILAFTHLHMSGTGASDYGVLGVMPGESFDPSFASGTGYQSKFQKSSEKASPGSYAVTLDRGGIDVEIVAAAHSALHRYTFHQAKEHHVLFDLGRHLESGTVKAETLSLDPAMRTLTGKLHSDGGMSSGFGGYDVYFSAQTSVPWATAVLFADGAVLPAGDAAAGGQIGVDLAFDPQSQDPVSMRIGVSLVSPQGAAANLLAETPGFDVDAQKQAATAAWKAIFDNVHVEGGCLEDQQALYSSLYHAFMMPAQMSDLDGNYALSDGMSHHADGFRFFSDLSLWDTYRTVHPLYALIAPASARDAVKSLEAFSDVFGYFPKWPIATGEAGTMIGSSAEIVVADGYVKGIQDFDAEKVYQRMRAAAMDTTEPKGGRGGRNDVLAYMQYGYVPETATKTNSVSITLEYARADYALATLAHALGHDDDAQALLARAVGYRKLFDPTIGFLRGKTDAGAWLPDPVNVTGFGEDGYVEASGWQTLWGVPNDVPGLIDLLGGKQAYVDKLTMLFEKGALEQADVDAHPDDALRAGAPRKYYFAGNEPDIHAPYMFAQAGRPDLTQKWVRWTTETYFRATPEGIPGNDDGGTMSSCYVFNALGFFPLPGTDQYILGTPSFPHVELTLPGGKLTIDADNSSRENMYVQSVTWNGQPMTSAMFAHSDIKAGGALHFVMGPSPSTWGQ